jgi:hypothetical protein
MTLRNRFSAWLFCLPILGGSVAAGYGLAAATFPH